MTNTSKSAPTNQSAKMLQIIESVLHIFNAEWYKLCSAIRIVSRRAFSKKYLIINFGIDVPENEPFEVSRKWRRSVTEVGLVMLLSGSAVGTRWKIDHLN